MKKIVKNGKWTDPKLNGRNKHIAKILDEGEYSHECTNYLTKANIYSAYWYKSKLYAIGSEMGLFGVKVLEDKSNPKKEN